MTLMELLTVNYQAVYDRLIAKALQEEHKSYKNLSYSRRNYKGSMCSGFYVEHHHIIPKSLGGKDSGENIVSISPRVHYLAHRLLSKIHGGPMAAAVWFMSQIKSTSGQDVRVTSRQYLTAREDYAEFLRSSEVLNFTHKDYGDFTGTIYDLLNKFQMNTKTNAGYFSRLAKGDVLSAHGWFVVEHNPDGLIGSELRIDRTEYTFEHKAHGRFIGTRRQLTDKFGIGRGLVDSLINGELSACGWYLPERNPNGVIGPDARRGEGNGFFGKRHSPEFLMTTNIVKKDVLTFIHKGGEEFTGTQYEFSIKYGLEPGSVSAVAMGSKVSIQGWFNKELNPDTPSFRELSVRRWRATQKKVTLYHEDGRTWEGYPCDAPIDMAQLTATANRHVKGWFLSEADRDGHSDYVKAKAKAAADARGDISGKNNPMFGTDRRVSKTITVRNKKTGEAFSGCSVAFADRIGAHGETYSRMMKTLLGKKKVKGLVVKSFWNWEIA
jgi:hypothetical protein